MPQSSHLDPRFPVTVMDVVQMGRLGTRTIWGPFRHADRVAAERCLEDVGMNGHESRPLSALSGGQRQRVLLARALACDPRLLLLDEPTSNVDVAAQDDLYKLLERLNERMTVMLVTHDLGVVAGSFKTAICVNKNVHVHSTSALSGDALRDLYERDVRVVQHDDHEHCDHGDGDHLGGGHRLQAGDRHG
jgi:zinc transport system ATP-binding protein